MASKKLIRFTVSNDLSYDQRMQRIAGVLVEAGFEVELIGRKRKSSIPLDPKTFGQTRLNCYFENGKLFYFEYNIRLFFYLLFKKAQVYGAVDLDTLLPCTLAAKIRGSKLVFDAHEYFTEVPEVVHRPITKAIWQILGDACIPLVDKAYTVGPQLAELFSKQYGLAFETILNVPLLQTHSFKNSEKKENIILYQGALNEGRGLAQLIVAMKQVNARLQIAGEGDLSESLRSLVQQNSLENKVEFLGFVKPEYLPELSASAKIAINLLEPKGLSYQYSLANKFFDYIHAGIPQLCADFIEYRKINLLFEVAILCDCKEDEIAVQLNNLLSNRLLYQRLQQNCGKAAQVYNLQREANKLTRIYSSLF